MASHSVTLSGVENLSASFSQTLERLSSKPGVIATVVVDRSSGALLQSTGSFSFWNAATSNSTSTTAKIASPTNKIESDTQSSDTTLHFTAMVCRYVESSGDLVHHMDSDDDLKLLRLRTKKHEVVIVPDSKFIFVVVHEISA